MKGKPNLAAKFKIRKENKMGFRKKMKDWIDFSTLDMCVEWLAWSDDDYE